MNFTHIKEILERALKEEGLTEYEIYFSGSEEISCETLNAEVNGTSSSTRMGLCLRILEEGRMGYASSERLEEEELLRLVRVARENAKATDKKDTVGIFKGSDGYSVPKLKSTKPYETKELRRLALNLANKVYAEGEDIRQGTSTAAFYSSFTVNIANSAGLNLSNKCAVAGVMTEAIVEKNGEKQRAYSVKEYEEKEELFPKMAKDCVNEAREKIGASLVDTGKYNVVFDGKVMRSLLGAFSPAFSAKRALDGLSVLKGKEGSLIACELVTITDDAMREGSFVGTPFDAEGVATSRKAVVEKGVLKTLLHNRESAMKMGVETTANASKGGYSSPIGISPFSFAIEAGDTTLEGLFEEAEDGIYVTEIKGLHAGANEVTGDFSLESAGFMIKKGKRAEAVKSFTVSDNFFDLLKKIDKVGNKVEMGLSGGFTNFGAPALLVRDMSVAGK